MKNLFVSLALLFLVLYLPVRVETHEKIIIKEVAADPHFHEALLFDMPIVVPVMGQVGTGYEACSSARVDVHAILTARHCFTNKMPTVGTVFFYGQDVATILAVAVDDNDHVAIRINKTFTSWATFSTDPIRQSERVSMLGNPAGMQNLFRTGYVTSFNNGWTMMDMNIACGDSGSGVFNSKGELIGTIETVSSFPIAHVASFRPYHFDQASLKKAGITFHY